MPHDATKKASPPKKVEALPLSDDEEEEESKEEEEDPSYQTESEVDEVNGLSLLTGSQIVNVTDGISRIYDSSTARKQ